LVGDKPTTTLAILGLRSVTPLMTVTRSVKTSVVETALNKPPGSSEGNLIQTLDGKNPARLLLEAIREHFPDEISMKEDDFYIGVTSSAYDQVPRLYIQ
jgi:hypothetical protein